MGRAMLWVLATCLGCLTWACQPDSSSEHAAGPEASEGVDTVGTPGDMGAPQAPPASPLRMLTPTQYNNTVRDLLGMPMDPKSWPDPPAIASVITPMNGERAGLFGSPSVAPPPWPWAFPPEVGVDHFEGMAEGQVPSPYGTEELQRAADHFAAFVLVSPSFSTCEDWAALPEDEQGDCAWSSLERFAQRAWRRPITEAETERLRAFFENNGQGGDLTEAVVLTAAGILQTPAFVFRMESGDQAGAVGEAIPLDDWEMASRLSYFLWNSMPDPQLFGAAARGELSTRAEVEAQARRMLDDPRARDAVVAFHHQWLGTRAVRHISPARRVYGPVYGIAPAPLLDTTGDGDWPAILGPVRHSMEAETHLFMERTIFDGGGTLEALLTDNHGYMSEHTEVLYGPDAQATPGARVDWDYGVVVFSMGAQSSLELYPAEFPPTERAGVLTLPAVLALGAYAVHPAPIIRGKLVLERLACQALGSPPPGGRGRRAPGHRIRRRHQSGAHRPGHQRRGVRQLS